MNKRALVLKNDVLESLDRIGVKKGQVMEVHTSMSNPGFVCGGPQVIIEALMETVGPEGTIVMPTQSWKNLDPSTGVHWEEPEEWWPVIRESIVASSIARLWNRAAAYGKHMRRCLWTEKILKKSIGPLILQGNQGKQPWETERLPLCVSVKLWILQ